MDPELQDLLAEVIEQHIAKILHLLLYVGLPFETLIGSLRQDVKLDEVLIAGEEAESFEQSSPTYELLLIIDLFFRFLDIRLICDPRLLLENFRSRL